jgi:hypothetical protein
MNMKPLFELCFWCNWHTNFLYATAGVAGSVSEAGFTSQQPDRSMPLRGVANDFKGLQA